MPAEAGDGDGGQAGGEMRLNERERLNGMDWSEVDDSGNGGRGTTAAKASCGVARNGALEETERKGMTGRNRR